MSLLDNKKNRANYIVFSLKILRSMIPIYVAIYFLVVFPFNIFLDRDLELNGNKSFGTVISDKIKQGKKGDFRAIQVDYLSNEITYSKWFVDEKLKIGDKVEVYYSNISPNHSILFKNRALQKPWNQNLFFRLLLLYFIGSVFAAIGFYFYKYDDGSSILLKHKLTKQL